MPRPGLYLKFHLWLFSASHRCKLEQHLGCLNLHQCLAGPKIGRPDPQMAKGSSFLEIKGLMSFTSVEDHTQGTQR